MLCHLTTSVVSHNVVMPGVVARRSLLVASLLSAYQLQQQEIFTSRAASSLTNECRLKVVAT